MEHLTKEDLVDGKPKLTSQITDLYDAFTGEKEFDNVIIPETRPFVGFLDTDDAVQTTFNFSDPEFEFENDYTYSFRISVLVKGATINEKFVLEFLYSKKSDIITKITIDDYEMIEETSNTDSIDVVTSANNENNTIDIKCTGKAGTTLKWKFLMEWTKTI